MYLLSAYLTLILQPVHAADLAGPPSPPGEPPFHVVVPEPPAFPLLDTANAAPAGVQSALQPTPAPTSLRLTTNGATVYCADRFLAKPLAGVPALDAMRSQLGTRTLKTFSGLGNLQVVEVPPGRTVEDCIQLSNVEM
jgi:hypothetical protein